jgi:hypothetical protein
MGKFKTNEDYFAYSKTLTAIPSTDLASLLVNHKIRIPYYIHRFTLKETIYSKVFQNKLYQTYTDELKYRLRGYHEYSLYLLEKLITDFNLDFDSAKYKEILFDLLFLNRELYGIKDSFLSDLEKLKYKYAVDFEKISYHDFLRSFTGVFYEANGYLDGVNLGILKDVMIHSSTLGDLRGLGEKFNVKIPRRINKTQLVEILTARFRLTEEEIILLNSKSVLELEIYAKEKGFHISIDLKKSDMIEYLVFSLGFYHLELQKDAHNYQIPMATELDAVQIDAIQFEKNDQDIPVENYEPDPIKEHKTVVVTEPIQEQLKPAIETPLEEEVILMKPEPQKVVEPVHKPEPVKVIEPVKVEPVMEEPMKPEPKSTAPIEVETAVEQPKIDVKPIILRQEERVVRKIDDNLDFSDEEKALLDEKINLIIKKYNKKRRTKVFWTTLFLTLFGLVILAAGYAALYYFYINPGNLPLGLPILW